MQAVPCESLKHMIVPIMYLAESQGTGHSSQVYKALYLSVVLYPIIIPKVFPLVILTGYGPLLKSLAVTLLCPFLIPLLPFPTTLRTCIPVFAPYS